MKKMLLAALILAACFIFPASASEAPDLSESCEIVVKSKLWTQHRLTDRNWDTYWNGTDSQKTIQISSPEPVHALYICWLTEPRAFKIEEKINGAWQTTEYEPSPLKHQVYYLNGAKEIRLLPSGNRKSWFGISELFVLGEGELPNYVQSWKMPDDSCDMLLLFAHPDDEALFFGGLLPRYAGEEKLDVVAAVLTPSTPTRKSELLNSLWTMGVQNYPVIGPFHDKHSTRLETAYKEFGKTKVRGWVIELIRKYRPYVMVTHDVNGEYEHGMHKMCADASLFAFEAAAQAGKYPDSAKEYGTFQVSKLYLHLYPENQLTMDWDQPLSAFSGRTGFEMAKEAYLHHRTQQGYKQFQVEPRDSPYSSYLFGLAKTVVGPDKDKDDLMENILMTVK